MYTEFYGFAKAPFNITPDPGFLFFSEGHREAFDHLTFGAQERKGFILITGEVGAGKTTLVNALTGFQKPDRGRVVLGGDDVTGWPAHKVSRAGLARTFQAVRLFRDISVLENIEAAGIGAGLRRREAALRAKPAPGRPPKLDVEARKRLERALLEGARAAGFPTEFWTCPRVAELIERRFGVR